MQKVERAEVITDANSLFAYDRVAYSGSADQSIHLRNLEVVAPMFGVPSVDLSLCRVLELGCADGTNLLPHAAEFPESHFVGVDLAVDSLATTRQAARQLDLQPLVQHQFLAELCFVLIHPFDGFEFELFDREPLTLPFEQGAVTVIDPFIRAALRELMERWPATTTVDEPRSLARRKTQPR